MVDSWSWYWRFWKSSSYYIQLAMLFTTHNGFYQWFSFIKIKCPPLKLLPEDLERRWSRSSIFYKSLSTLLEGCARLLDLLKTHDDETVCYYMMMRSYQRPWCGSINNVDDNTNNLISQVEVCSHISNYVIGRSGDYDIIIVFIFGLKLF